MSTQAFEVVHNLILDTIQPFIERIEALEAQDRPKVPSVEAPETPATPMVVVNVPDTGSTALQARVDAVLAMHSLQAAPAQWAQDRNGKRVPAEAGLWELTCSGCSYMTMWSDGDKDPRRCKTVETLMR